MMMKPRPPRAHPEIEQNEIELEYQIGQGAYGTVWKGRCRCKDVAVKVLESQIDAAALEAFRREVVANRLAPHPNVCLFMGACSKPGCLLMCMELLKQDMESLLLGATPLRGFVRLLMAKDAALGMNWLHGSNPVIIHSDLKTSNLLLDEHSRVKVSDFGLSKLLPPGQQLRGTAGSPLWMAPEVLRGEPFNEKADIYSFGLVLWQLLARKPLFPEYSETSNLDQFRAEVCDGNARPQIPTAMLQKLESEVFVQRDTITALMQLMNECWNPVSAERPSFKQIVTTVNTLILSECIAEPYAQQFWRGAFGDNCEEVLWDNFATSFSVIFHTSVEHEPMMRSLKSVLVGKPELSNNVDMVKIEQFGRALAWFGNLEEGIKLLSKIHQVVIAPWFHGDIDGKAALSRLPAQPGAYLIRFSNTSQGCFTISRVITKAGKLCVVHSRIARRHNGYQINSEEITSQAYPTLSDLIVGVKDILGLYTVCPSKDDSIVYDHMGT
ncbi:SHK1 protein [Pelomyxa schiedti]|nr:SHK1 protein [Pelomyxa schiedti]